MVSKTPKLQSKVGRLTKGVAVGAVTLSGGLLANYYYQLRGDHIKNPTNNPFLSYCQGEYSQGKVMWSPYYDSDVMDRIRRRYPDLPERILADPAKTNRGPFPYKVSPLSEFDPQKFQGVPIVKVDHFGSGGLAGQTLAFQQAINGKSVALVTYNGYDFDCNIIVPTSTYSAHHKENGRNDEISKKTVLIFFNGVAYSLLWPERCDSDQPGNVLAPNYNFTRLNWRDWMFSPGQWLPGIRTAWRSEWSARAYIREDATPNSPMITEMQRDIHLSGQWLYGLDRYLYKKWKLNLFRAYPDGTPIRGSYYIAANPETAKGLEADSKALSAEGVEMPRISQENFEQNTGVKLSNTHVIYHKRSDAIFTPRLHENMNQASQLANATVIDDERLIHIFVDTEQNQGGIALTEDDLGFKTLIQYKTSDISHAERSISVTGVSMLVELEGVALHEPIVCDGSNHFVPLAKPYIDPKTGIPSTVAQSTSGALVSPPYRGNADFHGATAIHSWHRVNATIGEGNNAKLHVGRAVGCDRPFGPHRWLTWTNIATSVNGKSIEVTSTKKQEDAGGGGLSLAGKEPARRELAELRKPAGQRSFHTFLLLDYPDPFLKDALPRTEIDIDIPQQSSNRPSLGGG